MEECGQLQRVHGSRKHACPSPARGLRRLHGHRLQAHGSWAGLWLGPRGHLCCGWGARPLRSRWPHLGPWARAARCPPPPLRCRSLPRCCSHHRQGGCVGASEQAQQQVPRCELERSARAALGGAGLATARAAASKGAAPRRASVRSTQTVAHPQCIPPFRTCRCPPPPRPRPPPRWRPHPRCRRPAAALLCSPAQLPLSLHPQAPPQPGRRARRPPRRRLRRRCRWARPPPRPRCRWRTPHRCCPTQAPRRPARNRCPARPRPPPAAAACPAPCACCSSRRWSQAGGCRGDRVRLRGLLESTLHAASPTEAGLQCTMSIASSMHGALGL